MQQEPSSVQQMMTLGSFLLDFGLPNMVIKTCSSSKPEGQQTPQWWGKQGVISVSDPALLQTMPSFIYITIKSVADVKE